MWLLWSYLTSALVSPSVKQGPTKVSTSQGYYKNYNNSVRWTFKTIKPSVLSYCKRFLNNSYYYWPERGRLVSFLFLSQRILEQRFTCLKEKRSFNLGSVNPYVRDGMSVSMDSFLRCLWIPEILCKICRIKVHFSGKRVPSSFLYILEIEHDPSS